MISTSTAPAHVRGTYVISNITESTDWGTSAATMFYLVPLYSHESHDEFKEFKEFKSKAQLRREQVARWNKLAQATMFYLTLQRPAHGAEGRKLQKKPARPRRRVCSQHQRYRVTR